MVWYSIPAHCLSFAMVLGEIVMLEGMTCVYRSNVDLYFYVMGSQAENEVKLGMVSEKGGGRG